MRYRYRIIVATLLLALLAACGEEENATAKGSITLGDLPPSLENAPHFSVKYSPEEDLKYEGRYRGLFPCADCEATELTLELAENKFRRSVRRIGKESEPFQDQGVIHWDESGLRFQLENDSKSKYLVADDSLYQLGLDGMECMQHNGKAFILSREAGDVAPIILENIIQDAADIEQVTPIAEPSGENSQRLHNFAGVYQGIYPCADCEGIEITLELTYDNGYTRTINYLGSDEVTTDSGMFVWDSTGDKITLADADPQAHFLVKADQLEQLDLNGDALEENENYRLYKREGEAEKIAEEALNDGHNAQNALSYAGSYRGLFPCADCEGIEVELTIDYDNQYERKTTYLGSKGAIFTEKGTFHWDKNGSIITLDGLDDGDVAHYFIGEGIIYQLNQEKEMVESPTGSDYSLKMIESRE